MNILSNILLNLNVLCIILVPWYYLQFFTFLIFLFVKVSFKCKFWLVQISDNFLNLVTPSSPFFLYFVEIGAFFAEECLWSASKFCSCTFIVNSILSFIWDLIVKISLQKNSYVFNAFKMLEIMHLLIFMRTVNWCSRDRRKKKKNTVSPFILIMCQNHRVIIILPSIDWYSVFFTITCYAWITV